MEEQLAPSEQHWGSFRLLESVCGGTGRVSLGTRVLRVCISIQSTAVKGGGVLMLILAIVEASPTAFVGDALEK